MTSPETSNTKVVTNGFRFLLVTHMVSSDAWFDSYGFLKSGQGAELIWTDQTHGWIFRFQGIKSKNSGEGSLWIP
jgi:hypothetical protein